MAKNHNKLHIALNRYRPIQDFRSAEDFGILQHLLETWHYYHYIGVWKNTAIVRVEVMESELVQSFLIDITSEASKNK